MGHDIQAVNVFRLVKQLMERQTLSIARGGAIAKLSRPSRSGFNQSLFNQKLARDLVRFSLIATDLVVQPLHGFIG